MFIYVLSFSLKISVFMLVQLFVCISVFSFFSCSFLYISQGCITSSSSLSCDYLLCVWVFFEFLYSFYHFIFVLMMLTFFLFIFSFLLFFKIFPIFSFFCDFFYLFIFHYFYFLFFFFDIFVSFLCEGAIYLHGFLFYNSFLRSFFAISVCVSFYSLF